MPERLISADSHVKISHEQIKSYLPRALHGAYDEAAGAYEGRMSRGTGAANRAGTQIAASNAAFGRPSYADPVARLQDMTADGVDVEVIYSEVSAFRYIGDMEYGSTEATRAFNDVLAEFAVGRPAGLWSSVPDPDPRRARRRRRGQPGRRHGRQVAADPGVPHRDRRSPTTTTSPTTRCGPRSQESGLPLCCHIGVNTALDDLTRRDPTPQKGVMVGQVALTTAEAFGMWLLTGVLERLPDLKIVFVEPGVGWVAWYLETLDDMVSARATCSRT